MGQVAATSFLVPEGALAYWQEGLQTMGATVGLGYSVNEDELRCVRAMVDDLVTEQQAAREAGARHLAAVVLCHRR
jgi:hypothetical protein